MANGTAPFHIFQFAMRRVSYYLNDVDPDVPEGVLLLGQHRHRAAMAALPIRAGITEFALDRSSTPRSAQNAFADAPRLCSTCRRARCRCVAVRDPGASPPRARRGMARGTPKRAARSHVWFEKVWDDDD